MEYLYKVLGIKATVQRAEFDHLPNYIAAVSYTHLRRSRVRGVRFCSSWTVMTG